MVGDLTMALSDSCSCSFEILSRSSIKRRHGLMNMAYIPCSSIRQCHTAEAKSAWGSPWFFRLDRVFTLGLSLWSFSSSHSTLRPAIRLRVETTFLSLMSRLIIFHGAMARNGELERFLTCFRICFVSTAGTRRLIPKFVLHAS